MMMTTSLKEIAYHEAGHAIATVALGHRVKSVTIKPGTDYLGQSERYGIPWGIRNRLDAGDVTGTAKRWIETETVIALAGRHAGRIVTRRNNWIGARSDTERAGYLGAMVTDSAREADAYLKLMDIRAEQLVNHPKWKACIKAVARELLRHETLSGQDVRLILANTLDALHR